MTREKSFNETQEDILRERAQVLARAGESVHAALERLRVLEKEIDRKTELYYRAAVKYPYGPPVHSRLRNFMEGLLEEINGGVAGYNEQREYAKVRYYYLIVTREAMGFRRHQMVEEIYRIPEKKRYLERPRWMAVSSWIYSEK